MLLKECLSILLACVISICYFRYLWRRRSNYRASLNLQGPRGLPFIGSALYFAGKTDDILNKVSKLCDRYPRIFGIWLGPKFFYVVTDPKYLEKLLTNPQALNKGWMYDFFGFPVVGQGLATIKSVTTWKTHRKIINPAFSRKILDPFVDTFVEHSQILVKVLEQYDGKGEFDIFKHVNNCTLDFICETAMGVQMQIQRQIAFFQSGLIGFLNRQAFLDLLMDENKEGKSYFTDEQLIDETLTFILAGSDTSAIANCFVLEMMGLHQKIQEQVLDEILEVVGPEQRIQVAHLPHLKLIERVIKETLRLFPIGPLIARETEADINLGNHIIHKGCAVAFPIFWVQRCENFWPNPLKFDPDRFLPEAADKITPGSYIPFSYGPRSCIGMKYAIMSMKTLLVTGLRKYKVFTSYKSVGDIELGPHIVLRPKDGFKIYLECRQI